MRALMGDELKLRFWLDDEGFVRQMELPITVPGEEDVGLVIALLRFFDHDEPITIEAPPANRVASP